LNKKKELVRFGISVNSGIAVSKSIVNRVLSLDLKKYDGLLINDKEVSIELKKLLEATSKAKLNLENNRTRLFGKLKNKNLGIFEFQTYLLHDSSYIKEIKKNIQEKKFPICKAIYIATEGIASKMKNVYEDIIDVGNLICSCIEADDSIHFSNIPENKKFIFVTDILTPSIVSFLVHTNVQGIITQESGKNSHAVILSESLGIPVIVDIPHITEDVEQGDIIGMDGDIGKIIINPSDFRLKAFKRLQKWHKRFFKKISKDALKPAKTKDNVKIQILANVELSNEVSSAKINGAEGIGLYRTEFLFLENPQFIPNIQIQYNVYRSVVTEMEGKTVIFRTLDIGGDKIPFLNESERKIWIDEQNPALGYRGIRLIKNHKNEILLPQLKAILKASAYGPVKIMLPMISLIEEFKEFNILLDFAMKSLRSEAPIKRPEIGIMLETPASIIMIDKFSKYVDFFSIGTNDLTQYILAVDRENIKVSYIWDHYHPTVLRFVKKAINYAKTRNKYISICGQSAGDPYLAAIFIGFGINILSVTPSKIPEIKYIIRQLNYLNMEKISKKIINMETSEEVRNFIKRKVNFGN